MCKNQGGVTLEHISFILLTLPFCLLPQNSHGRRESGFCLISLASEAPPTMKDMEESLMALLSLAEGSFLVPPYVGGKNNDICKILSLHNSLALEAITLLHDPTLHVRN